MISLAWKPYGMTSNDFAIKQKHILQSNKICYAGRLDPMAQGQMLLLCDDKVREMDKYLYHDKTYHFDLIMGLSTDSHDPYGKITSFANMERVPLEGWRERISDFIDTYDHQEYPMKSSYVIRHDGVRKPLWWFAEQGYHIPPPSKKVQVYSFEVKDVQSIPCEELLAVVAARIGLIHNQKTMRELQTHALLEQYKNVQNLVWIRVPMCMSVSSGFYIRRFCHDFGTYVQIPCVAMDITRTTIFQHKN